MASRVAPKQQQQKSCRETAKFILESEKHRPAAKGRHFNRLRGGIGGSNAGIDEFSLTHYTLCFIFHKSSEAIDTSYAL